MPDSSADKLLAIVAAFCTASGIVLFNFSLANRTRSYAVGDDLRRGRARRALADAYGELATLFKLSGMVVFSSAWGLVAAYAGGVGATRYLLYILVFAMTIWASVFWHETYRMLKTLEPGTLLPDDVPAWRQRYSLFLQTTFGAYDEYMPATIRWLLARIVRPSLPVIIVSLVAYSTARIAVTDQIDYRPFVFGPVYGLAVTKLLCAVSGSGVRDLYALRDAHYAYVLVRTPGSDQVLVAHQRDAESPFYDQWCLPQLKLASAARNVLGQVSEKTQQLLKSSSCGLRLRDVEYALQSTFKLYDDFSHDNWHCAHLFICETTGHPLEPTDRFRWASPDDDLLIGDSRLFVADLLITIESLKASNARPIKYWSVPRHSEPDLSNRPH